jgi:murein DD-endopeptidase MepM/ murein hydrolase activator NlpD
LILFPFSVKTKFSIFRYNSRMKKIFAKRRISLAVALSACAVTAFSQTGKTESLDTVKKDEIRTVIYELPYLPGKKVSIVQGYNGWFSHKGENSLDFLMRRGEVICAARGGVVVNTRSDSKKGGASYKYINDGNYVIIKHDDSTSAAYWHMEYNSIMVKSGDTVVAGQPIGKVGTTGFSSGPHLHFEVYYYDRNGRFRTLKTVFRTSRGLKKPRGWHFYKRPK